jgi:membrane-associated phospholipid phosphatase
MTMKHLLPIAAITTLLTIVCIVAFDEPFARWIATRETYPRFWNEVIGYLEYPLGIEPYKWAGVWVLVGGSVLALAITRLRPAAFAFLAVASVHLLDRNLTFWLKVGTGRLRPSEWLAKGGDIWFRDGGYSFPSGHITLFASIVFPLAVIYPRTRPLLAVVAFAFCARLAVNAHFLSDVLGGVALTALVTWLCVALLRRALPSLTPPACRK